MATNTIYTQSFNSLGTAKFALTTDTLRVMLCTSTYAPNRDTQQYKNSVSNEITGTNYVARGIALTGVAWTLDATNHAFFLTANNPQWPAATFTFRYAVFYKDTGTDTTSPLLSYVDFVTDQSISASNYTLSLDPTNGFYRLTAS